jgi:hypothetical protein
VTAAETARGTTVRTQGGWSESGLSQHFSSTVVTVSEVDNPVQSPERAEAENRYVLAQDQLTDADNADTGTPAELSSLGYAQVYLLETIYHELRHGHDQAAAQSSATLRR